jgi:hypothetical protein
VEERNDAAPADVLDADGTAAMLAETDGGGCPADGEGAAAPSVVTPRIPANAIAKVARADIETPVTMIRSDFIICGSAFPQCRRIACR